MSRTRGHQSALARYIRNRYAALPGSMRSDSIGVPAILSSTLCPASVLCPSRLLPFGVLPLAGQAAEQAHHNGRIGIGTTGSPVPCQRLRRAHATYTPDTAGPARRPPPGSGHTRMGVPSSRGHLTTPVSMPSFYSFDASAVVHTCSSSRRTPDPLTAGLLPQRSPPRLLTDAACGGLSSPLHGEPGGPTSITGTARIAPTISYIVITPLSGHTQVEVATST